MTAGEGPAGACEGALAGLAAAFGLAAALADLGAVLAEVAAFAGEVDMGVDLSGFGSSGTKKPRFGAALATGCL
jgi:hypothetical protein